MVTTRFMQLLLEALANSWQRKLSRLALAALAVALCLVAGGSALIIWTVLRVDAYGRRTGDWSRLDGAPMLIVPLYYLVAIPPAALFARSKRQMRLMRRLCEALATAPAQFAPPMPVGRIPFPESGGTSARRYVVYPLEARPIFGSVVIVALICELPLWVWMLLNGLPWTVGAKNVDLSGTSSFDLIAGLTPLLIIITQFIVVGFFLRRRLVINADEVGLSWRMDWSRQRGRISWNQVSAFYVAKHKRATLHGYQECLAHVLVTSDDALGWLVPAWAKTTIHYDMWRLARDIETHTGQSPRDLGVARAIAEREIREPSQLVDMGIPITLVHAIEHAYRYMTRRIWLGIATAVVLGLPLVVYSIRLISASHTLPPRSFVSAVVTSKPSSAQAGLLLVNSPTTGAFTNFAVYPVKPPSSLQYV